MQTPSYAVASICASLPQEQRHLVLPDRWHCTRNRALVGGSAWPAEDQAHCRSTDYGVARLGLARALRWAVSGSEILRITVHEDGLLWRLHLLDSGRRVAETTG